MDELGSMILHRCNICGRHFSLYDKELQAMKEEGVKYITCSYNGKHNNISVIGKYDNIKECMQQMSHKRVSGKIKQIRY